MDDPIERRVSTAAAATLWRPLQVVWLAVTLSGCALFAQPDIHRGQTEADVRAVLGHETGRYAMPDATTRLEFATGPYGRTTWMVDVDTAGRVISGQQVLTAFNLADVQGRAPGMTREELLRTLGRPGERRNGDWQGGEVWSWRYPTNDCVWFQSSIGDDGIVRDGVFGIDPRCAGRGGRR